jgi:thioredoxin reductase (NADPH)
LDIFDGQRVLIVGGGDSAMDWSLALKDRAAEITQIHRRSQYRAQAATVEQVRQAAEAGKLTMLTNYELAELVGEGDKIREAVIFDNRSQARKTIPVDKVLLSTGMLPDLGDINEWGLDIEDGKIAVDPYRGYATNLPGIFAIGDVAHFAGKVELIITGFGEAATAAYYAYEHIHGKIKGAAWCAKLPT